MTKHTAGPWEMWSKDIKSGVTSIGVKMPKGSRTRYDAVPYCVMGGFEAKDESIMEANARLIRAAPEMLEMLKEAQDYLDCDFDDEDMLFDKITALITEIESE